MTTFTVAQFLSAEAQGITLLSPVILDTSANVAANLDALEPYAGKIGSIQFTDTGTPNLTLSATQDTDDAAVISDFLGQYSLATQNASALNAISIAGGAHVDSIAVVDTAANIQTSLDQLEAISSEISSVTIPAVPYGSSTLLSTVSISPLQLYTDLPIIKEIQSSANVYLTISGNISLSEAITALRARP